MWGEEDGRADSEALKGDAVPALAAFLEIAGCFAFRL